MSNVAAFPRSRLPDLPPAPPERPYPHNFNAEQALLGAILVNNLAYHRVSDFLTWEHFANQLHGEIYRAASMLIENGKVANPLTLISHFKDVGSWEQLEEGGGAVNYIARLAASATTIVNAKDYGEIILDLWRRRALIAVAHEMTLRAYCADVDSTALDVIREAEEQLTQVQQDDATGGAVPMSVGLDESITSTETAMTSGKAFTGVPTGFTDLDRKVGGFQPSDLVIIGGRPSMGKTTLAVNIFKNSAREGYPGALFSQEMSRKQIADVILASETGISVELQKTGALHSSERDKLREAATVLKTLPLYIDDRPQLTVSQIRAQSRLIKRRHGLAIIFIDYLQLIRPPRRTDNRVQDLSEITASLKALAKELHVPVVVLSQLSRAVEGRDDKRPTLADLRESGSIEQDADVVMFPYRHEYYLKRSEPAAGTSDDKIAAFKTALAKCANRCDLYIPKNRNGSTGQVRLFYREATSQFRNYTETQENML